MKTREDNPHDWFFLAAERLRMADTLRKQEGITYTGVELLHEAVELDKTINRRYIVSMTTLTLTQARANLSRICGRARKGEEIGIIYGDRVLQIIPIEVRPVTSPRIVPMTDAYVQREYGLTPREFAEFRRQSASRYSKARREGKIVSFKGKFDPGMLD